MTNVTEFQRRLRRGDDTAMTLVDLVVSMGIMSIVMAVFTTAVVRMYRSANVADARANAQTQIGLALQRLDKEVRYASGIGQPYLAGGGQRIEFLIIGTAKAECVQLQVSGGQLRQRMWTYQSPPVRPTPTPWTTLASGLTSPEPFTFVAVSDDVGYQRLRVRLTAVSGGGSTQATRTSDITFTALNTTRETATDACAEGKNLP